MKKTYGYCRISTPKQSIDRQIRNIKGSYPDAVILQEAYTGTKLDRPVWTKLCSLLKSGDVIVFDSVSRMSRDAEEGFKVYEDLYNKGIELVFLKEPHISTETYRKAMESSIPLTGTTVDYILEGVNRYLLSLAKEQIRLAFEQAEKEVMDLRQRTREGIETARLKGRQIGSITGSKYHVKKADATKEIIKMHSRAFGGTLSDAECITLAKIGRNAYYRYKSEIKSEREENGT